MLWNLYCRVIDNHGDLGVCWRLASALASRGESVRLHVDDASALAWMAPERPSGIEIAAFDDVSREPGDVVIEAFGCDPPPAMVARMRRAHPPVWINLEYLSAEPYVERSHGLPSPRHDGLCKWFYYPGFTERTGGLIREPRIAEERAAFEPARWLASHGLVPEAGERVVSLFCYANPALAQLLATLAAEPTLLLCASGAASDQVREHLGPALRSGALRAALLPRLAQRDYDRLLWSSELNLVRGEDSFVRAQWAGAPFIWQAYPQHDGAHRAKLGAFLELYLNAAAPALACDVRALWRAWNGFEGWPSAWPDTSSWRAQATHWRSTLLRQADLVTRLLEFVAARRR